MAASFPTAYLFHPISAELKTEKRSRGRCVIWSCKRRAARKKGGRCETCASRLFRFTHDDTYAYQNLKRSARIRGIGFELSFEDFMEFCCITGYLEQRGKNPTSLSIDRIKNHLPYCMGNIRILTYADNVSHKYEEAAANCKRRSRVSVPSVAW